MSTSNTRTISDARRSLRSLITLPRNEFEWYAQAIAHDDEFVNVLEAARDAQYAVIGVDDALRAARATIDSLTVTRTRLVSSLERAAEQYHTTPVDLELFDLLGRTNPGDVPDLWDNHAPTNDGSWRTIGPIPDNLQWGPPAAGTPWGEHPTLVVPAAAAFEAPEASTSSIHTTVSSDPPPRYRQHARCGRRNTPYPSPSHQDRVVYPRVSPPISVHSTPATTTYQGDQSD